MEELKKDEYGLYINDTHYKRKMEIIDAMQKTLIADTSIKYKETKKISNKFSDWVKAYFITYALFTPLVYFNKGSFTLIKLALLTFVTCLIGWLLFYIYNRIVAY